MEIAPYVGEPDGARLVAQLRGEPVDRVPHEASVEDERITRVLDPTPTARCRWAETLPGELGRPPDVHWPAWTM